MRTQVTARLMPTSLVLIQRRGLQDVVQEKASLALLPKISLFNPHHTEVQEYRASPTCQSLPHAKDRSL